VFLYKSGGSNVLATRDRILVWQQDKIDVMTEFSTSPMPALEKRGFLDTAFLVEGDKEAKVSLAAKDLISLTGFLGQDFSSSEDGASNADSGLSTWVTDSGDFFECVRGSLIEGERLLVLAAKVSNTSLFVTNMRIGIVKTLIAGWTELTPVICAQHRLSSVKRASFAKAIKNIKVTLEVEDGTNYDYAKVRPGELEVVERLTQNAIDTVEGNNDLSKIIEFAALTEDHVATVQGYAWSKRQGDNTREVSAKGHGSTQNLVVFKRVILQGNKLHLIDGDVSAEVTSNGGVQVTHRPTMTRMAAGAILPGTALIPGLAFQKKKSMDSRTTYFVCAHPEWMLDVNVDPDAAGEALKAAKYINKQAELLAVAQPIAIAAPPAPASAAEQLREMKALLDEGVITQEDFDKFKASVLG
jgi:hypothetical protein